MRRVTVALDPAYDVVVGPSALDELDALRGRYRRLAVVTQPAILEALGATGRRVHPGRAGAHDRAR